LLTVYVASIVIDDEGVDMWVVLYGVRWLKLGAIDCTKVKNFEIVMTGQ
jgi:hypothetical protein